MRFEFDPNRLHWYDGQVLSCHDFHQVDNLVYNTIGHLASIIAPYSWGVIRLELDQASMSNNLVRITEFQAIMPDYTYIKIPLYNQSPLEIDLNNFQNKDAESFIYCSLSKEHSLVDTDFSLSRYKPVQTGSVMDHNTNSNPKALNKLMPVINLTTQIPNSVYFPLLKFTFSGNTIKILEYDPPTPILRNCKNTFEQLQKVLGALQSKLDIALNKLRLKNNNEDFKSYGYIILQELCPLFALINSESSNPFQVFLALSRLSGALSRIVSDQQPRLDLYYDHTQIYEKYSQLILFIKHKITKISNLHSLDLSRFTRESASLFNIKIKSFESPYIYLVLQFKELMDYEVWIKQSVICSQTSLQNTLMQKTLGCIRRIIEYNRSDNLINVKVEIIVNTSFIKDNILCIANYINTENAPENIYLLIE